MIELAGESAVVMVYVLSGVIVLFTLINFVLSKVLYEKPRDKSFFNNVGAVNLQREKTITAMPKYVVFLSVITGVLLGLYLGFASVMGIGGFVVAGTVLLIFVTYLMEITRTISLRDGKLVFWRFLAFEREIEMSQVSGIYIYSFNKKFLRGHAYTTKLVIVKKNGEFVNFTLSSLDNRAVLNLMKECFGVNSHKMFISKRYNGNDEV